MRANEFLGVKRNKEHGTAVVFGLCGTRIRVLGSSVPLSAVPGYKSSSFSFSMEEGQRPGLIAVSVMRPEGKGVIGGEYFLPTRMKDGAPYVDLEEPWVPLKGRLGQVHGEGVEILIGGKTFTTVDVPSSSAYNAERFARDYFVPDPNIICRYLAGDVGADAVIHAAVQYKVEVNARARVSELERELAEAREQLAQCDRVRAFLAKSRKVLARELAEAKDRITAAEKYKKTTGAAYAKALEASDAMSGELGRLKMATKVLLTECKKRRFKSSAFVRAIVIAENRL